MKFSLLIQRGDRRYEIESIDDSQGWKFALTNQDHEGMSISENDLFEIVDKYFKEHF